MLQGLDGAQSWGLDASDVLSPRFIAAVAAAIAPRDFRSLTRDRSSRYAPVQVVGIDVDELSAKARIRAHDGELDVVSVTVDPQAPHLITRTYVQGLVPRDHTPRLPADFSAYDVTPRSGAKLVAFSGLPGSGKSTTADAVGDRLGIPVFSVDWLLGALTPFGIRHCDQLGDIGYEQVTTLALRQLRLGQSAILDAPAEDLATRRRWRSLAGRTGADFAAVVCVCSDLDVHRARLETRDRGIPGWHQGGDWDDVLARREAFVPWNQDTFTVDTGRPLADNVAAVIAHLSGGQPPQAAGRHSRSSIA